MNDKTLRLFLAVADKGSFSGAEAESFVSKQAILKQINALEEELGVRLLERSNQGVRLTEAGQTFYQGACRLLELQEQLIADCRKRSREENTLRVGNVEHQALLSAVTDAFSLRYPDVAVRRVIHPNHSGEYRVEHGIMDVAETFYSPALAEMDVSYTPLIELPYRALVREGHPLAGKKRVGLRELRPYRTVIFRPMTKPRYLDALKEAFRGAEEKLDIRVDVDHQVPVAFECVEGDDVLLTANYFIYHLPNVKCLPLEEGWSQEYGILYRSPPGVWVQRYVDLAVSYFKELKLED